MGQQQTKDFKYSVPIGEKPKGSTKTYRCAYSSEGLTFTSNEEIKTMRDSLLHSAKKYPNSPLLGTRDQNGKYQYRTYQECVEIAGALGTAIKDKKLTVRLEDQGIKMDAIGIFAKNREEWLLTEYADFLYNFTLCPLYDSLGPESIGYVLEQTEIKTIIVSNDYAKTLLKCKKPGKIENLVIIGKLDDDIEQQIKDKNWKTFSFWGLIEEYKSKIDTNYPPLDPDDIFTFSYTSGTTGDPKGALISHRNILSVCIQTTFLETKMTHTDSYLSYLPLPHVLERLFVCAMVFVGGKISFYQGDVLKLKDDLEAAQPTIFCSVPRLYTKFYGAIKDKMEKLTGISSFLANKGLSAKQHYQSQDNSFEHKFWDSLVFKKTKAVLGGKVRIAATGGAPISEEVLKYLRITLCVPIQEGYGATETTGATFFTSIHDPESGHVGGIQRNMEFKLEDIPDMNYTSESKDANGKLTPQGEICVRGHGVFRGYFKQPEKTKEVIDEEGWYHTGDVGQILDNGALKIIDRKKNLFKLSQGEYIAPEKIENLYVTSSYVDEVFVHGESLESTLLAFAVPNKEAVENWAKQNKVEYENYEDLCKKKELRKMILKDFNAIGKQGGLFGFEQARNIYLEHKPFSEYDIMTNTFKIKRRDAKNHYKEQIKQLYQEKF